MSILIDYAKLMRLHRPIGIYLVLWPTLWALWLAAEGVPELDILLIFIAGVVLMRSAGCVINDYADRHIDGHIKRTKDRPIVAGRVSPQEALVIFAVLCLLALLLVLQTNLLTVYLSVPALVLAAIYPFMKRHTHLPQVFLGAAFACSVPMAFAAQSGSLDERIWLVYTTVVIWTVTYDTFYAMADRAEDIMIGVKSTAILFADADRLITGCLQIITLIALVVMGQRFTLGDVYFASLMVVAGLFLYQQYLIRQRKPLLCFRAFLNNNWVGIAVFAGIAGDYASKPYL